MAITIPTARTGTISWFDWAAIDAALVDFTARLIRARLNCPALCGGHALTGQPIDDSQIPDVTWHLPNGSPLSPDDWHDGARRTLIVTLYAAGSRVVLALHAGTDPIALAPPPARAGWRWHCVIDTANPARDEIVPESLAPRSVLLLQETPATGVGIAHALPADALDRLAQAAGIAANWWDVTGHETRVSDDTKRALLAAMRLPAGSPDDLADSMARIAGRASAALPASLVVESGTRITVPLGSAARGNWLSLEHEDGTTSAFPASRGTVLPPLPVGRYRLRLDGTPDALCHLTVAPPQCYLPADLTTGQRTLGIAAHLYTLRRAGDQGIGDFTSLAQLGKAAAAYGATVVGINPLHALFPVNRDRASPYHPSDRRFLDPIYLDVSGIAGADDGASVDYAAVWARKLPALRTAFEAGAEDPAFAAFLAEGGTALRDFARFEAITTAQGSPHWQVWPADLRHPAASGVTAFAAANDNAIRFSAWLQFQAEQQFAAATSASGLRLGFYRDLAVGSAPDGAEAWSRQDALLTGVSIGAPPDPFAQDGQVWSLPPPDPLAMAEEGYAGFAALLTANMRHAGALRIDHVMGLQRLFLVPDGATARDGAYLTYPLKDLLGQVTLESQRARCVVVGEDLGTVPEGFSDTLRAANVLSYSVLWFERDGAGFVPPDRWKARAAACVSTHDLPTLAGWWEGADIAEQQAIGMLDGTGAQMTRAARLADKQRLVDLLLAEGLLAEPPAFDAPLATETAGAVHALIAATPALLALVQADDLAGETEAVNLPGTDRERPNWRRRLRLDVEDLFRSPAAEAILDAIRKDERAEGRLATRSADNAGRGG